MIGMTLCSGIGAPEVAAPCIDWRLAAEIEPFPRAVLQERFGYRLPADHNQGEPLLWSDMTEVTPDLMRSRGVPLPDLIVAGTPCQAFSVAGARKGLADARGNLTLAFVEICHAIVSARPDGRLAVLWENVPGVLSDDGNAFGCFLGGLVGAVDALPPPADGSWPGEGMVQGPRARAAWAVLDAQWFGVAQRRRRVFVVVDFGNCVDPAAVLLEPDRLRGDSPPRREAGQRPAPTISARTKGGGGLGTDFDCDGGLIASTGDVALCLNAGGMGRQDYETETMVAHALRGEGFDASEDGTGRGTPLVPMICPHPTKYDRGLCCGGACFDEPVAFDCKGTEVQYSTDGSHPTLRSMGHSNSHQNAGGHAAVAFDLNQITSKTNRSQPDPAVHHTLPATACPPHLAEPVAFDLRGREGGAMPEGPHYTANIRAASGGSSRSYIAQPWAVRRLMPVETARLQGFEDHHTAIAVRGKPAADGPQYKAHGNSMAVPVIRWIMERMRISMEGNE